MNSLIKKYLMALTGLVLVGFVFVHMTGNLQIFLGQDTINAYAYFLQNLPMPILWGSRLILFASVFIHIAVAVALIRENKKARPIKNEIEVTKKSKWHSLRMGVSGSIILAFIFFHLFHYTIRIIYPEYDNLMTTIGSPPGEQIHDVYAMMIYGFKKEWISIFYVVAMFLLCKHLVHGVSSTFQSLGLRTEAMKSKLDIASYAYAYIIFIGFAIIPIAVVAQKFGLIEVFNSNLF